MTGIGFLGAGFPILAIVASIIVVLALAALPRVEQRFFSAQQLDEYTVDSDPQA